MMYQFSQYAHLVGFVMLAGGIFGLFITDIRSRQVGGLKTYAEMVRTSSFYQRGLVTPGVFLLYTSGTVLIVKFYDGWGFIEIPWLAGMVILFLYEYIKGNVFMRRHKIKLRGYIQESVAKGYVTQDHQSERDHPVYTFSHFMDLPNFLLLVSLGALKPTSWTPIFVGIGLSLLAAAIIKSIVVKRYPWQIDQEGEANFKTTTPPSAA